MAIPRFLAMTADEIRQTQVKPPQTAYLSCHFSLTNSGLTGLPDPSPGWDLIIVDDRNPILAHDPELVVTQLSTLSARRVLLDFQRPPTSQTASMTNHLVQALPCVVAAQHAGNLDCPVFLPPIPLTDTVGSHLQPWQGRELWLELALDAAKITITEAGSVINPILHAQPVFPSHVSRELHCHYHIHVSDRTVDFTLFRTPEDLQDILEEANGKISCAVGLYQELGI
jgi:hypothetical protein